MSKCPICKQKLYEFENSRSAEQTAGDAAPSSQIPEGLPDRAHEDEEEAAGQPLPYSCGRNTMRPAAPAATLRYACCAAPSPQVPAIGAAL